MRWVVEALKVGYVAIGLGDVEIPTTSAHLPQLCPPPHPLFAR